jgi:hypothetical protein
MSAGQEDCPHPGGLAIPEENDLAEYQERGRPLEPWVDDYLRHERDRACPDCFGRWPLDWLSQPGGGAR